MNKPNMYYQPVKGVNPKTKAAITRPQVANVTTYYEDQFVAFALSGGYVRGQFEDCKGQLNGFIEAMKVLGQSGYAVTLGGWFRVDGTLTGQLNELQQLTDKNEYRVNIRALQQLKRKASDFSWTNLGNNGNSPKVEHMQSVGAEDDFTIFAGAKINVSGKNMKYQAGRDKITASWVEVDSETGVETPKTIEIVPDSSGSSTMTLPWPTGLTAPVGSMVTFGYYIGGEGVIPANRTAGVVAAPSAE